MRLGLAIRKFRSVNNVRQKELAGRLGISVKHLACIELGISAASSTVRRKICEMTGITEEYNFSAPRCGGLRKGRRRRKRRRSRT